MVLAGNDGEISVSGGGGADINMYSNDEFEIYLDNDGDNESANFSVSNGSTTHLNIVTDDANGDIILRSNDNIPAV